MKIDIATKDMGRYLRITLSGTMLIRDAVVNFEAIVSAVAGTPHKRVLIDAMPLKERVSFFEMPDKPEAIADETANGFHKIAVLDRVSHTLFLIAEDAELKRSGYRVRFFFDEPSAEAWLLSEEN
jgi:hypothetical protein